jgi:predicted nuclease of predicted toxin-antitoxin system
MRFLADDSCDFRVVRALRTAGYDVVAVIEVARGADDDAIIAMAIRERRVLITEDRDFGQLVHAAAKRACGVILLRYPSSARADLPATVIDFVEKHGTQLVERFVVVEPGRIRIGGNP